jgi:signal peptidase I
MAIVEEKPRRLHPAESLFRQTIETVQWLLIALILALFFRAFIMEAYRIPTGSMAMSLKGAHFRLFCPRCGFGFDRGFDSDEYGLPKDVLPESGKEIPVDCRCPNCGYVMDFNEPIWVANGDRILVLKCRYQLAGPKRWDVVVFKDPTKPAENVIKRLIALPGETVEIIDGDIYINGTIAAKPDKLQEKLWIQVYDNDYQPVRSNVDSIVGQSHWQFDSSDWRIDDNNITCFKTLGEGDEFCELVYDGSQTDALRAGYAYNGDVYIDERPYCSDLKVRFFARSQGDLNVGAQLSKYGQNWRGWVEKGVMFLAKIVKDKAEVLVERPLRECIDKSAVIVFTNVDHRLVFSCNDETVSYAFGGGPDDMGERLTETAPVVKVLAAGKTSISHLAIFRDIHYTEQHFYGDRGLARAGQGNAFTLQDDEYFVLGDNSPNSYDGRWWTRPGKGNNGVIYRAGIVPRDYLVGKAVFVYWPSGFRLFQKHRPAVIPNVGKIRFIYGGSGR